MKILTVPSWGYIQDGATKVSYLCSCSHTSVWSFTVMLKERLFHVRLNSLKSTFLLSQCFSIPLRVMAVLGSTNSECMILLCHKLKQSNANTLLISTQSSL